MSTENTGYLDGETTAVPVCTEIKNCGCIITNTAAWKMIRIEIRGYIAGTICPFSTP
jgi:hypothetical protein